MLEVKGFKYVQEEMENEVRFRKDPESFPGRIICIGPVKLLNIREGEVLTQDTKGQLIEEDIDLEELINHHFIEVDFSVEEAQQVLYLRL